MAWCHHELGWVALAADRVDEAGFHFERALMQQTDGGELLRPHVLAALATVAALAGDEDRAEALGDEAILMARGVPLRQILVAALVRASEVAVLTSRLGQARAVLLEVLGILRDLGARRWVADTLEAAALVLEAHGGVETAARLLGTSDALRLALNEPVVGLPALSASLAACRNRIETALGAGAVASAALSPDRLDQVLNLALSELEDVATSAGSSGDRRPRGR